jgi:hypothetical protein
MLLFSADPHCLDGFGTVFDSMDGGGNFGQISTAAVLELFRNVNENEQNFIEIEMQDVEEFNVERNESNSNENVVETGNFGLK